MIGVGIPDGTGFEVALGAAIDIRKRNGQWQAAPQNQRIILIISIFPGLLPLTVGLVYLVFFMLE